MGSTKFQQSAPNGVRSSPHKQTRVMKCFHHDVDTRENMQNKEADVASLKELLNAALSDSKEQRKLDWTENPNVGVANSKSNKHSIHFSHRNLAEQMAFGALLTADKLVELRGLLVTGNLERWPERLHNSFREEAACIEQIEEVEHGQQRNGALFLLLQAIPCILHMENRVGVKVMTKLLIRGFSNVKEGMPCSAHKSMNKRIDARIEDVTNIASMTQTLCQWRHWGTKMGQHSGVSPAIRKRKRQLPFALKMVR